MTELPYPPVFHDWRYGVDARVSAAVGHGGVLVEMKTATSPPHTWHHAELTENDAVLLAASLLDRAGYDKLRDQVLGVARPREANLP